MVVLKARVVGNSFAGIGLGSDTDAMPLGLEAVVVGLSWALFVDGVLGFG